MRRDRFVVDREARTVVTRANTSRGEDAGDERDERLGDGAGSVVVEPAAVVRDGEPADGVRRAPVELWADPIAVHIEGRRDRLRALVRVAVRLLEHLLVVNDDLPRLRDVRWVVGAGERVRWDEVVIGGGIAEAWEGLRRRCWERRSRR
jgi:hypothetical protein